VSALLIIAALALFHPFLVAFARRLWELR